MSFFISMLYIQGVSSVKKMTSPFFRLKNPPKVQQSLFFFDFSCCFLFLFFVVDLGYVSDWGALFGTDLRDVSERFTLGLESGSDWVCFPMPTGMAAISECFLEGLF